MAQYSVLLSICVDNTGHIVQSEVALSCWPEGYLFIRNDDFAPARSSPPSSSMSSPSSAPALGEGPPATQPAQQKRRRSTAHSHRWLLLCRVDGFRSWAMAVHFWHLWNNSGERGPSKRARYGLLLYWHYASRPLDWNGGSPLRFYVPASDFAQVRKRLADDNASSNASSNGNNNIITTEQQQVQKNSVYSLELVEVK
jgi:hypothetical protein